MGWDGEGAQVMLSRCLGEEGCRGVEREGQGVCRKCSWCSMYFVACRWLSAAFVGAQWSTSM